MEMFSISNSKLRNQNYFRTSNFLIEIIDFIKSIWSMKKKKDLILKKIVSIYLFLYKFKIKFWLLFSIHIIEAN